jgi:predicted nucleic acid-binding protein
MGRAMINEITKGPVVIDNTTLSNFSLAEVFHLLNETLRGNKIITVAVKTESLVTDQVKQDVTSAIKLGWLEVHELHGSLMLAEYYAISKRYPAASSSSLPKLGDGEAASIVYAKHMGFTLITDDNGPKKLANSFGITTIGSIGILYLAKEKGLIDLSYCNGLFMKMKENGAFFPKKYPSFYDCIPTFSINI